MKKLCLNKKNLNKLPILVLILAVQDGESYMVRNNPHHLRETLDPQGRYQLEWLVDLEHNQITFNVTAKTTGFIGFGLSDNGKMSGADIVIGGVDSKGRSYFADYHAVGNQQPIRDQNQDWKLLFSNENSTHTMLTFSRLLDTCDAQDYPITEDKISIIWAIGARDDIQYHHGNRGVFPVHLLHPDYSPQIITEPGTGIQKVLDKKGKVDSSVKVWTLTRDMEVPPQETLYWCTMHKAPRLKHRHQLIGTNVRLHSEESIRHVHHFVLYKCNPPRGSRDGRTMFESYLQSRGQECLSQYTPTGPMPTEYCTEMRLIWAVGGRAHFQPPHVGFPFESEGYYILQVHLDNPSLISNTQVSMSVDLFYTENVRPHEGGIVSIRQETKSLPPSLLVPPHSIEHQIRGICGSKCTQKMLPANGVTLYGSFLHTHNAGRRIRVRHFRKNRELPFLASDENFSFSYQQMKNHASEQKLLPGDQFIVECVYDTTQTNKTVVGGFSSSQEMCTGNLLIYDRIEDIVNCNSQIELVEDRRYFLENVENVTWSNGHIDHVVDPPHPLAGLTISEVSDNHVQWTIEKREELQRYHLYRSHINRCQVELYSLDLTSKNFDASDDGVIVSYPYGARPYQPQKSCTPNDK